MTTQMATRTDTDPAALYWSEDGQVMCGRHSPYRGSDTWRSGRWSRLTADDQTMWRTANPKPASCETCDCMARKSKAR